MVECLLAVGSWWGVLTAFFSASCIRPPLFLGDFEGRLAFCPATCTGGSGPSSGPRQVCHWDSDTSESVRVDGNALQEPAWLRVLTCSEALSLRAGSGDHSRRVLGGQALSLRQAALHTRARTMAGGGTRQIALCAFTADDQRETFPLLDPKSTYREPNSVYSFCVRWLFVSQMFARMPSEGIQVFSVLCGKLCGFASYFFNRDSTIQILCFSVRDDFSKTLFVWFPRNLKQLPSTEMALPCTQPLVNYRPRLQQDKTRPHAPCLLLVRAAECL